MKVSSIHLWIDVILFLISFSFDDQIDGELSLSIDDFVIVWIKN